MNSVVLKTDSPFMQWYFDKLKPWIHYVPLSRDLSDLMEKIDWINAHDSECERISHEATSLIKSLTFEKEVMNTVELLEQIFSCRKDK